VHVVEATKQLHRPIPVHEKRKVRRLPPVLVPVPASQGLALGVAEPGRLSRQAVSGAGFF
jgi:hypothetical protein